MFIVDTSLIIESMDRLYRKLKHLVEVVKAT